MRACLLACFLFSFFTMTVRANDIELSTPTRSKPRNRVERFKQRKEKEKQKEWKRAELEKQERRIEKELGEQAVWETFALIRRGELAAAERKLLEDPLLPDFASVWYGEIQEEGPFRRVSFKKEIRGKFYLWGCLALAYLNSWMRDRFPGTVYLRAREAFLHISEKYDPRVRRKVEEALDKFARNHHLDLDESEGIKEVEAVPPSFPGSPPPVNFMSQPLLVDSTDHPLRDCI